MTLGQGHDTPLGQGQQLCEILSRSDKWLRSYGQDLRELTDRQTDRQIPIYPLTLFAGVITNARNIQVTFNLFRRVYETTAYW